MKLNASHAEHAIYALLMQSAFTLIGLLLNLPMPWWAGAAFASAWFISREHTQKEYKLFTFGDKPDLSALDGFKHWSEDAILDAAVPTATVLAAGTLLQIFIG